MNPPVVCLPSPPSLPPSARDKKEVEQCIRELESPQHHAALLYRWMTLGLDKKEQQRKEVYDLLAHVCQLAPLLFTREQAEAG